VNGVRLQRVAALVVVTLLSSACGGSGSAAQTVPVPQRTSFDAANFVDPTTSTNQWYPLKPGTQWVVDGTTEVGSRVVPHRVIATITDVVRLIDGVPAVAMFSRSTDSGQIAQLTIDYMALDKDANVWIVGGYTENYEGGVYTNADYTWLGKASGDPGILMPANPIVSTPRWHIGEPSTDEPSAGEVVAVGAHQCVPFACYDNVLVIREGKVSAIDNEFKFYAPGVGLILNSPRKDSKHKDTEKLVNLTQLSPVGLAEMSAEVMRLEAHARDTMPDVFAHAPASNNVGVTG